VIIIQHSKTFKIRLHATKKCKLTLCLPILKVYVFLFLVCYLCKNSKKTQKKLYFAFGRLLTCSILHNLHFLVALKPYLKYLAMLYYDDPLLSFNFLFNFCWHFFEIHNLTWLVEFAVYKNVLNLNLGPGPCINKTQSAPTLFIHCAFHHM